MSICKRVVPFVPGVSDDAMALYIFGPKTQTPLIMREMQLEPASHLTNVRSDRIGREVGCDIEHPITTHVIWHRNCLAEISVELREGGPKVG